MTDKGKNCSLWLKFFRNAGIPSGFDTKYAVVFDENRIKMDMLMDLNKECLRDMGITAMGDIIAILKHARFVHEETKEQAFETVKPANSAPAKAISRPPAPSTAATTSGSFKPVVVTKITSAPVATAPPKPPAPAVPNKRPSIVLSRLSTTVQDAPILESPSPTKTSTVIKLNAEPATNTRKKIIILNKRSTSDSDSGDGAPILREEVPLQKKIRVLPEHEGRYKIKMPEGTTLRTQKILQNRLGPSPATIVDKKTNVFERLGGDSRSSSISDVRLRTNITRLFSDAPNPERSPGISKAVPSIFDRLGGRHASPSSMVSTLSKPSNGNEEFLKTKFEIRQQHPLAPLTKPRPNPAVYREKTLTTIHSRITTPMYRDKPAADLSPLPPRQPSRLRSEINAPPGSSKSSSIISRLGTPRTPSPAPSNKRVETVVRFNNFASDSDDSQEQVATQRPSSYIPHKSLKVVSSSVVKRDSDLSSRATIKGTVLKEERIKSATTGKYIIRRTIVKKKKPKSVSQDSFQLPEIDDPLEHYFENESDSSDR